MLPVRPRPAATHAVVSRENIRDGAAGGPRARRVQRLEPFQDLARTPAVAAMLGENQIDRRLGRGVRRRQRRPALLLQPTHAERQPSLAPFYPVFRLMPYRVQSSVIVRCPLAKS